MRQADKYKKVTLGVERVCAKRDSSWRIAKKNALLSAAKAGLVLVQTCIFYFVWVVGYREYRLETWVMWQDIFLVGIYFALTCVLGRVYGGYQISRISIGESIYSIAVAQVFVIFFQYLVLCITTFRILNPVMMLVLLVLEIFVSSLWAPLAKKIYGSLFPARVTYIIYQDSESYREIKPLYNMNWKFSIQGALDLSEGLDCILGKISQADAVFLCGLHSSDRNTVLKYCIDHGIQVYIRPKIGDLLINGSSQMQLMNMLILHCGRNRTSFLYQCVKRLMDITMSGLTLIVISPIMFVVGLAIHIYDRGPAFYKQVRLTKDGKQFEILKFRSMREDAEKDGVARLATEGDDRITPIGRFIRKVRLDELPQLINILKGDMSIVGPRPERPEIAAQYEKDMPEFGLRLQAKAGLTGYAQVYGKYNTRPYDKLQMDLLYIANQSILLDWKIIFATVKVLFMPESTQGIAAGQLTASGKSENTTH